MSLNTAKNLKVGTVSIVGRPNVGKSTLLNAIIGEKVSIVSQVPQTTRQQIRGIYTDERGQIVFIDTPGLHLGGDRLDKFMNRSSLGALQGVDVIIHLADASEMTGQEEKYVVSQLKHAKVPVILGLNKIDYTKGKYIPEYIQLWESMTGKSAQELTNLTLLPLSALKGRNVEKLLDLVFGFLPEGPLLYPEDVITDLPQGMAMADLIREKLFHVMREEIPHSIAVRIERVAPRKGKILHIRALISVERDTQKEIVIGKKGAVLKEVGTQARKDLEDLLEQKVFLELFVKTTKNWRDDPLELEEMDMFLNETDMGQVIAGIKKAMRGLPDPSVTLVGKKFKDPFLVLISCLLSLRTKDTTTLPVCERLFAKVDTIDGFLRLSPQELEKLIYPVGFYKTKARTILAICKDLKERFNGQVPPDMEQLLSLKGVGRKTANLVLTEGFGQKAMCVDTHVHRISNRLGFVKTKDPHATEFALRKKLPKKYWNEYNALLVTWGQNVCKPVSPLCSKCPVNKICQRIDVKISR